MQEEREREKIRPKKDGDQPIEDDSPQSSGAGGNEKAEELKKKAEQIKKDTEKYRKRSREKATRLERDAPQVREQHKNEGGE